MTSWRRATGSCGCAASTRRSIATISRYSRIGFRGDSNSTPMPGEPEQKVRRTLEGALERITGFTASFDSYRIEIEEVVVGDERIAVRVRHVGSIGGRELSEREAHVWVFARDRPVALHEFRDWDRARSEAGVDMT
jgi:hypothetical protein